MIRPVVVIHGGAGAMSRSVMTIEKENAYVQALRDVLNQAHAVLADRGTALDAVTVAVRMLEDCPLFNAGRGAVFTSEGTHELDASIMDGATLRSGAIANVRTVRNPVLAARSVMEQSQHVFFVGQGAEAFARDAGLEMVDSSYFSTDTRREQWLRVKDTHPGTAMLDHDAQALAATAPIDPDRKLGTVGAVAIDCHGNLAAATSTGGITNKQAGRVGDAPLIGAGCYASNRTCAVSTTGTGEMFIRTVAAYDVAAQMDYAGRSLGDAASRVVFETLPAIDGKGGLIAVDAAGNIAMPFNTEGMYRGYARTGQAPVVAIYRSSDIE